MIKYKDCPMCHQPLVDLSNNPAFVNHNPENFDASTGTNRSNSSNIRGNVLTSDSSGSGVCDEGMV